MNRLLLILTMCAAARAAITNVQVTGRTSTQAILSYTAPDARACTLEVSESAGYSPLIHDVETALFAGSNLDSRAGNITAGRSRTFVIGKRTADLALDSKRYSRALQVLTSHYYRVTCGADVATGTFTTANIPLGKTYSDPLPVDPANPGNYAWPTVSTTDRTASFIDPLTGVKIKNLTLTEISGISPKAEHSDNGSSQVCGDVVVPTSDGKAGYHCIIQIGDSGGLPVLYWIDRSTGDSRLLGIMHGSGSTFSGGYICGRESSPFSSLDPNKFYCLKDNDDVIEVNYTGHASGSGLDLGQTAPLSENQQLPNATWTSLTASPRGLTTLVKEFDSAFSAADNPNCGSGGVQNGKMIAYCRYGNQDTIGWIIVFDPTRVGTTGLLADKGCVAYASGHAGKPGCVIAATSTYAGAGSNTAANRWGTIHAAGSNSTSGAAANWILMGTNSLFYNFDGGGPYSSTITAITGKSDTNLPATGGACPARPSDSPIPVTDWPITNCNEVTVAGEPTSTFLPTSIGSTLVGDLLSPVGSDPRTTEWCRLLIKTGNVWWIQRGWGFWPSSAQTSGKLYPISGSADRISGATSAPLWWDFVSDPHGASATTVFGEHGAHDAPHISYGTSRYTSAFIASGAGVRQGAMPGAYTNPITELSYFPAFAGISLLNNTNQVEAHGSYSQGQSVTNESQARWILDCRSYMGDTGSTTSSVVLVTGQTQLYKVSAANVSGNFKKIPILATSGSKVLLDISGPASSITNADGDNYKYCIAYKNGECYAGSTAGEIYANAPGVAVPGCASSRFTAVVNDLCFTQHGMYFQGIQQSGFIPDGSGSNGRMLSNLVSEYKNSDIFWNARSLPDASWALVQIGPIAGYWRDALLKLPPWPAVDSVNRGDFIPVSISLKPPAGLNVDNAVVEFGYDKNLYCTSRTEKCIKGMQSGNKYDFAEDSVPGVPCRSGCKITVPTLSQRVLYYRILYRNAANLSLGTSSVYVLATP